LGGIDWANVGIGVAALLVMAYVLVQVLPNKQEGRRNEDATEALTQALTQVIENNTKAIEQMSTVFQVSFARQDAKLDEVVDYVRRCRQ
jgi:hypothetical protein